MGRKAVSLSCLQLSGSFWTAKLKESDPKIKEILLGGGKYTLEVMERISRKLKNLIVATRKAVTIIVL